MKQSQEVEEAGEDVSSTERSTTKVLTMSPTLASNEIVLHPETGGQRPIRPQNPPAPFLPVVAAPLPFARTLVGVAGEEPRPCLHLHRFPLASSSQTARSRSDAAETAGGVAGGRENRWIPQRLRYSRREVLMPPTPGRNEFWSSPSPEAEAAAGLSDPRHRRTARPTNIS